MKNYFFFIFLMFSISFFSQKKISKQFETTANEINIYTAGLDTIVLENSDSGFVEVFLYAEDYDQQFIKIENSAQKVDIKFDFEGTQTREVVFRKFITKRLQRAAATVKIPKNKKVYIFGENVDIESKNLKNELAIYIENGIVKLNEIKANTTLKLYSGNVYALIKNTKLNVKTVSGKLLINDVLVAKEYQKTPQFFKNELTITTIKANIFLNKLK